ncbi:hypothetical protein T492DRAFT_1068348 [Pavlovales sp. CCMP2436]|nr:hypothetical protein T492DRAFT_1068348 [Pavlovales sp. CCMP2436]
MATDPAGAVEGDSSQSRRSSLPAGARCGSDSRKAMSPGSSSPWHCGRLRMRAWRHD